MAPHRDLRARTDVRQPCRLRGSTRNAAADQPETCSASAEAPLRHLTDPIVTLGAVGRTASAFRTASVGVDRGNMAPKDRALRWVSREPASSSVASGFSGVPDLVSIPRGNPSRRRAWWVSSGPGTLQEAEVRGVSRGT